MPPGRSVSRRDRLIIRVTIACCVTLPWPVAFLTHNRIAAGAAFLIPAMIGGALLRRRGWKSALGPARETDRDAQTHDRDSDSL